MKTREMEDLYICKEYKDSRGTGMYDVDSVDKSNSAVAICGVE